MREAVSIYRGRRIIDLPDKVVSMFLKDNVPWCESLKSIERIAGRCQLEDMLECTIVIAQPREPLNFDPDNFIRTEHKVQLYGNGAFKGLNFNYWKIKDDEPAVQGNYPQSLWTGFLIGCQLMPDETKVVVSAEDLYALREVIVYAFSLMDCAQRFLQMRAEEDELLGSLESAENCVDAWCARNPMMTGLFQD